MKPSRDLHETHNKLYFSYDVFGVANVRRLPIMFSKVKLSKTLNGFWWPKRFFANISWIFSYLIYKIEQNVCATLLQNLCMFELTEDNEKLLKWKKILTKHLYGVILILMLRSFILCNIFLSFLILSIASIELTDFEWNCIRLAENITSYNINIGGLWDHILGHIPDFVTNVIHSQLVLPQNNPLT